MSLPSDFSATESADYSYLFYTRANGTIAFLKSNTTQEDNDTTYTASSVIESSNVVIAAVPRVSAVSYTLHGKREVSGLLFTNSYGPSRPQFCPSPLYPPR